VARKQMVPQMLEKARFAEENGSGRGVETDVRVFFKLQKNEVKRLKSLSRAQNRASALAVDRYRDRTWLRHLSRPLEFKPDQSTGNPTETPG
jgi:hypothetical protein